MKTRNQYHDEHIQNVYNLSDEEFKHRQEKNLAEWNRGTYEFVISMAISVAGFYGFGAFMTWLGA